MPPALSQDAWYDIVEKLTHVFSKVWGEEKVPLKWTESIFICVFKKGSLTVCENQRRINLLQAASQFFASVVFRRLKRDEQIREKQMWFQLVEAAWIRHGNYWIFDKFIKDRIMSA